MTVSQAHWRHPNFEYHAFQQSANFSEPLGNLYDFSRGAVPKLAAKVNVKLPYTLFVRNELDVSAGIFEAQASRAGSIGLSYSALSDSLLAIQDKCKLIIKINKYNYVTLTRPGF